MSPSSREALKAPLLRALALAEEAYSRDLRTADLADAAGYSLFYFCRLFNRALHLPPYEYLTRRRLSLACQALETSDISITETALSHGFDTPEGFSRAFRRMFGLLPSEAREKGFPDKRRLCQRISEGALEALLSWEKNGKPAWADKEEGAFSVRPIQKEAWPEKGRAAHFDGADWAFYGAEDSGLLKLTLPEGKELILAGLKGGLSFSCLEEIVFSLVLPSLKIKSLPEMIMADGENVRLLFTGSHQFLDSSQ